jgi:predicted transposase YbfD/YdcC
MPELKGAVITADALHLHEETSRLIVQDKGGHLLVGLKGNRETLLNEVMDTFARVAPAKIRRDWSKSRGHGRIETRIVEIIPFTTKTKYPHLQCAIRVDRTREIVRQEKIVKRTTEVSYYVASFSHRLFTAKIVQELIRGHWTIENRLHHVKDRTMREDRYRARANVGSNVALIRSVIVMIKARRAMTESGIRGRLRGNADYAISLLFSSFNKQ